MRTGFYFISLLFCGMAFLFFKDAKTARDEVLTDFQLTHDQLQAAKAYISLYESGYYNNFFPFSRTKIALRTYVYDIMQYIVIIGLLLMLLERCTSDEFPYVSGFMAVTVGDLIDYILTHNDPYFTWNGYPISFNIVSIAFYTLFCTYITLENEHRRS